MDILSQKYSAEVIDLLKNSNEWLTTNEIRSEVGDVNGTTMTNLYRSKMLTRRKRDDTGKPYEYLFVKSIPTPEYRSVVTQPKKATPSDTEIGDMLLGMVNANTEYREVLISIRDKLNSLNLD